MISITTMENLMFGATLNTDGSHCEKFILLDMERKLFARKIIFIKNLLLQKFIRLIRFRKQLSFAEDVQKKSKCIKSILQHFKLATNFYTKNDSGYIPSPVRKRKRYQYNNSHRETKKAPVPEEKKWDIYHEGRICYYCQKQMRTQFVIHGSNIFHNNCCLLFLNEEKQPSFDTSIYKNPESENLIFIQWSLNV